MTWRATLSLCLTAAVMAAALLSGCALPSHLGRGNVSHSLACRTGHTIGPEFPPCAAVIPDFVDPGDGLTEDEAAAIALWNHPGYRELLADLEISRADIVQANQLQNPEISNWFPVGPKQWELTLYVPIDVLLLRPKRLAAAQFENSRVAERLVQDGLNVIRDTRLAYADLALAEGQLALTERGLALRGELARIARERLRAGAVAELDTAPMRLDAMFARDDLLQARRDAAVARQRLRYALGLGLAEFDVLLVDSRPPPTLPTDVEELVAEAVACRPDLIALRMAYTAAVERARLARYDYLNIAAMLPDINGRGVSGFEAGPGIRMTLPLFNQNQGAISRAEALAEQLARRYENQRQTVAMEVRTAWAQLVQADESLRLWHGEIVPQAEAAAETARRALELEGVEMLIVLESSRQLLAARQRELAATANLRRALAELERSVGRRLIDEELTSEPVPPPAPEAMQRGREPFSPFQNPVARQRLTAKEAPDPFETETSQ